MWEAILNILVIMGWLGVILAILAVVNIVTGTLINIWKNKEKFDKSKMFKGIIKFIVFYTSAAFISIAFTMLPFINEMIINAFNIELISDEILNTISSVGVLSIVISTIVIEAKKAIQGIIDLAKISSNTEISIKDEKE